MLWGGERYFRPEEEPPRGWEKVPVAGDGVLNQGRRHRGRESLGPTAVPATVLVKPIHIPWHRTRPQGRKPQWVSLSLTGH